MILKLSRLIFTLCILHFSQMSYAQSGEDIAVAEIRRQIIKFSRFIVNSEYDSIALSYTHDAKIFPSGMEIIQGREMIKKYWILPNGSETTFHKIYPEEIFINGNQAYDYGHFEIEGITNGVKYERKKGKYVIVWKQINGEWKMYLDIWNRI